MFKAILPYSTNPFNRTAALSLLLCSVTLVLLSQREKERSRGEPPAIQTEASNTKNQKRGKKWC